MRIPLSSLILAGAGLLLASSSQAQLRPRSPYAGDARYQVPIEVDSARTPAHVLLARIRQATGRDLIVRGDWLKKPAGLPPGKIAASKILDRWADAQGGDWRSVASILTLVPGRRAPRPVPYARAEPEPPSAPALDPATLVRQMWEAALPTAVRQSVLQLRSVPSLDERTQQAIALIVRHSPVPLKAPRHQAPADDHALARIVQTLATTELRDTQLVQARKDLKGGARHAVTVLLGLRGHADVLPEIEGALGHGQLTMWMAYLAVRLLERETSPSLLPVLSRVAIGEPGKVALREVGSGGTAPSEASYFYPVRWQAFAAIENRKRSGVRLPSYATRVLAQRYYWGIVAGQPQPVTPAPVTPAGRPAGGTP